MVNDGLVNVLSELANWRFTIEKMGKSTISMGRFR